MRWKGSSRDPERAATLAGRILRGRRIAVHRDLDRAWRRKWAQQQEQSERAEGDEKQSGHVSTIRAPVAGRKRGRDAPHASACPV